MQEEFLEKLYNITESWWKLIFKTDEKNYFDASLELIKKQNIWTPKVISYDYENEITEKYDKSNLTEFEVLFRNKDIKINYAEFIKV
jgi:tRNA G46 methylase TrmB